MVASSRVGLVEVKEPTSGILKAVDLLTHKHAPPLTLPVSVPISHFPLRPPSPSTYSFLLLNILSLFASLSHTCLFISGPVRSTICQSEISLNFMHLLFVRL